MQTVFTLKNELVELLRILEELVVGQGSELSTGTFPEVAERARAAEEKLLALGSIPPPPPTSTTDPRIRLQVGKYRVVAPALRTSERGGTYINGQLVIEQRDTDSLGVEVWRQVGELNWHAGEQAPSDRALFVLLAGKADDRGLRDG